MDPKKLISQFFPPLCVLVLCTTACEVLVQHKVLPDFLVPAPSQVWEAFLSETGALKVAALSTLGSASAGLGLSLTFGLLTAFLLSFSQFLYRAVYPYLVFFQTVPVISIAPLLVIWFGFGQPTAIASAFIVSVFPIIANTLLGLRSTDPIFLDPFRLYTSSKTLLLMKVRLPLSLPYIFSGLRIAAGLAIVGAIVGEFIGGGGIGNLVDTARTQQRVDLVFAAVLASSALGLFFVAFINYLSRSCLKPWHASEQQEP